MNIYALDKAQVATILASLRFYQERGMGDPANRSEAIHDIATCGDEVISLDADAIDVLCEDINGGEACISSMEQLDAIIEGATATAEALIDKSKGFTVWVMEDTGRGTHHVSHHAVETAEEAERLALAECAADWERDDTDGLEVLGVAVGNVRLHSWNDPGD